MKRETLNPIVWVLNVSPRCVFIILSRKISITSEGKRGPLLSRAFSFLLIIVMNLKLSDIPPDRRSLLEEISRIPWEKEFQGR